MTNYSGGYVPGANEKQRLAAMAAGVPPNKILSGSNPMRPGTNRPNMPGMRNNLLKAGGLLGLAAIASGVESTTNASPNNRPNAIPGQAKSIDQFSDDDFIREAKRRVDPRNPENMVSVDKAAGSTTALDLLSDPRSPFNANSGIVKNQDASMYADRDDSERRFIRANNFQLENQLKKAGFDNQFQGAQNLLNNYVQLRQSGNQLLAGAYQFKY